MPIAVSVNAGANAASSTVTTTGSVQHIITDAERAAFKIDDAGLKAALAIFKGQAPDDAFVCSPTPWGDLYSTYGWPQVQTLLSVQSSTILEVTSVPTTVASQRFENTSGVAAEFNCGITQAVTVGTESTWSQSTAVGIGQTISYEIGFLGSGAGGETSLTYEETWEKGGSESESVTLGTSSGLTVTLQPGQSVEADLIASRGVLKVQVVYQLTLTGYVAMNYSTPFNGHHFWAAEVNAVMAAAGYPTSIVSTETIEIDYYANSTITLKNPAGQVLRSFVVGARPGVAGPSSGMIPLAGMRATA
jgi:hypothetical protein